MNSNTDTLHSVIIPVGHRVDDFAALVKAYIAAFENAAIRYEVIIVFDGMKEPLHDTLKDLGPQAEKIKAIRFTRAFGESVALMAGFREASGDLLVTLPAYWQVDPDAIESLIQSIQDDDDMLIAVRWPRSGSTFDRLRRNVFHWLLRVITGQRHRDLGCGVRVLRRDVANETPLYGDQHRFFPVLAHRRGFNVREVEVSQSHKDVFRGRYRVREYFHRILDILTVFFLVRFTKKPLRFFGSIGFLTAGFGSLFVLFLVGQRLVFGSPLADRPALLLASLLIVLGVQLFGLGLLGELVIFSHAGKSKEYAIRSITSSK